MNSLSVFRPTPSIYETKFHRGFHRRRSCDHVAERAKIDNEAFQRFNSRVNSAISSYMQSKRNVVTGEGLRELAPKGRKSGANVLGRFDPERVTEARKRVLGSDFRFFTDWGFPRSSAHAAPCQTMLVGYPAGRKRNRTASLGIFDNFEHTQAPLTIPSIHSNKSNISQISFG